MITIMIFIGLMAVLGGGCYCLIRWVLMERWSDWKKGRQELQQDQMREQKKLALRYEALDSVLTQIGQTEERDRRVA